MSAQHIAPAAQGDPSLAASELSIRRMIAHGRSKLALDNAKDLHKKHRLPSTESLLVDAYVARIRQLAEQKLEQEANSLWQIVLDRYPEAAKAIGDPFALVPGLANALADKVRPLADPALSPEQRQDIEEWVRTNLADPADLAACDSLPSDHPIRTAAAAVSRALTSATSAPVRAEQLALPEVSRRSPLAPWKSLVNAIGAFYRHDDDDCASYLNAISPDSAPARLVPTLRELLAGARPLPAGKQNRPSEKLVGEVCVDRSALRRPLTDLEREFNEGAPEHKLTKAIRAAVADAERLAPKLAPRLKQHIAIQWREAGLPLERLVPVIKPLREDAYYFRLLARCLETVCDAAADAAACEAWDQFRQAGAKEGWFAAKGPEVGGIYLQMATVVGRIAPWDLGNMQRAARFNDPAAPPYFLWPEKLFELAVEADPEGPAYPRWLAHARLQGKYAAERVAERWHAHRPKALQPLLFLIDESERRKALQKAAKYLALAEAIDSVHPGVRQGKLRVLIKAAIRHVEQGKAHLVRKDLDQIDELPQSRQPDKAPVVAALRVFEAMIRGDKPDTEAKLRETQRLMGGDLAAAFLMSGLVMKGSYRTGVPAADALTPELRIAMPEAIARACSVNIGLGYRLGIPYHLMKEALTTYKGRKPKLDNPRLEALGRAALDAEVPELAYLVSADGLASPGNHEALFLLLRAKSIAMVDFHRSDCLLRAATELARRSGDAALVEEAMHAADHRESVASIAQDLLDEIRKREPEYPEWPRFGSETPDYSAFDSEWDRSGDGFDFDEFDEDDDDDDEDDLGYFDPFAGPDPRGMPDFDPANFKVPGVPSKVVEQLLEQARASMARGESFEEFVRKTLRPALDPRSKKGPFF